MKKKETAGDHRTDRKAAGRDTGRTDQPAEWPGIQYDPGDGFQGYQRTGAYEDSSAGRKAGIRAFECQGKRSGKVLSENFK